MAQRLGHGVDEQDRAEKRRIVRLDRGDDRAEDDRERLVTGDEPMDVVVRGGERVVAAQLRLRQTELDLVAQAVGEGRQEPQLAGGPRPRVVVHDAQDTDGLPEDEERGARVRPRLLVADVPRVRDRQRRARDDDVAAEGAVQGLVLFVGRPSRGADERFLDVTVGRDDRDAGHRGGQRLGRDLRPACQRLVRHVRRQPREDQDP